MRDERTTNYYAILELSPGASDAEIKRAWHEPVSYTHLRAHETVLDLVCRLLLEKKKKKKTHINQKTTY